MTADTASRRIGVRDEYRLRFGRQVLTVWSGEFCSDYEATAVELPLHDGFMVTVSATHRFRVHCPAPRTSDNFEQVDAAIQAAFTTHH